jgi:hypothetical protein
MIAASQDDTSVGNNRSSSELYSPAEGRAHICRIETVEHVIRHSLAGGRATYLMLRDYNSNRLEQTAAAREGLQRPHG